MRTTLAVVLCLGILVVSAPILAGKGEEVTLTGRIACAKCELNKSSNCQTVIVVNEDGKDVLYYLDAKSGKANHEAVCQGGKDGSVTGTVSEKDGKKFITASKVELK